MPPEQNWPEHSSLMKFILFFCYATYFISIQINWRKMKREIIDDGECLIYETKSLNILLNEGLNY